MKDHPEPVVSRDHIAVVEIDVVRLPFRITTDKSSNDNVMNSPRWAKCKRSLRPTQHKIQVVVAKHVVDVLVPSIAHVAQ